VEEIPAISGPAWVKATAYPGAVWVSWAFVKDAKSYSVYRQRSDGGDALLRLVTPGASSDQSTSGYDTFGYLDVVTTTNQLADGVEYTYYVTTNNGQGVTGRATSAPDETLIYDGAASTAVTAKVPARIKGDGTWTEAKELVNNPGTQVYDADAITVQQVKTTESYTLADRLLISFPRYNPGLVYNGHYDLGTGLTLNLNPTITPINPTNTNEIADLAFYHVPLFGGVNQLRLDITLGGDYYYKASEIVKELPEYGLTILTAPSFANTTARSGTTAKLVWTAVAGAPNAADYTLSRIAAKNVANDGAYTTGQMEVEGDWVPVPIALTNGSASQTTSGTTTTITVQDTGLALDKGYLYALSAKVGDKASVPAVYGLAAATVPAAVALDIQTLHQPGADADTPYRVTVGWNAQEGVSYKLYKAPLTKFTSITPSYTYEVTGNFEEIQVGAPVSGRYTVQENPAIRRGWKYRLVSSFTDAPSATTTVEKDLIDDAFNDYVSSALTVTASTTHAYAIDITIGNPSNYPGSDYYVDIYRATIPENLKLASVDTNGT
jgi:hypothetical protein